MQDTNNNEFICDDRPREISEKVKNMTQKELDAEFQRRFGKYISNNDVIKD